MSKSPAERRGSGGRRVPTTGDRTVPKRDLGPAAHSGSSFDPTRPFDPWQVYDEFTKEAIEMASVLAEIAVQPCLASGRARSLKGVSVVELRFLDDRTLTSFRRTHSVRAVGGEPDVWRLVRRWASAGGDGCLDEAMCLAVARFLNADFAGLLTAEVVTWILRDR